MRELRKPMILEYDTATGPVVVHVYPMASKVAVIEPDKVSWSVESDLVVSFTEREILMSDALIEELSIIILSSKSGLWRFSDDPEGRVRVSRRRQFWVL